MKLSATRHITAQRPEITADGSTRSGRSRGGRTRSPTAKVQNTCIGHIARRTARHASAAVSMGKRVQVAKGWVR